MLLTKAEILGAKDLNTKEVDVSKWWGGKVLVRCLTAKERDKFESDSMKKMANGKSEFNTKNLRARLVSLTVVDEQGNRLFTDDEVEVLGNKAAAPLDLLFDVAQRLSGIGSGSVDEALKNSETIQEGDSVSD